MAEQTPPRFRTRPIIDALIRHDVDFVIVGGIAGVLQGSSYPTYDLDVAYERSDGNLDCLAAALRELGATLRGAPKDLPPFKLEAHMLEAGANFTFDTTFGKFDILGDAVGAPSYLALKSAGRTLELEGARVRVASLDHLIQMKEAAGRTKDKLMATEYRQLADRIRAQRNE